MNKQEWEERVAALKKELAELENNPPKREPGERWEPENGEVYWCVNEDYETDCFTWCNDDFDDDQFNNFNVFQTKDEAEFARERKKVMRELDLWAVDEFLTGRTHCGISYDINGEITTPLWLDCYSPHIFESREVAKKAIDAIGEERLKKYYFRVVD